MADAPPAREKRRSIFNLQGSRPRLRATGASYPVLCPPHRDTFILAPLYMKVNINFSFFQKFFFARSRSKNRRRAAAPPPIQIERKCRRQGERTPQARQARQGNTAAAETEAAAEAEAEAEAKAESGRGFAPPPPPPSRDCFSPCGVIFRSAGTVRPTRTPAWYILFTKSKIQPRVHFPHKPKIPTLKFQTQNKF